MSELPNAPAEARIEIHRDGPPVPWLGQLVPIDVDVWRPQGGGPLEAFSLDDVVAAGMIAKWSAQTSPPEEKQLGELTYLVQHRTLLLFPESEGELALLPLVARWTDPSSKAAVAVHSQELKFTAAAPPTNSDTLPLVATSVVLEQTFDRELTGLRVGDGFTRTVTLRATDTDPVVFPELTLAEVAGMSAYATGAHAESSTERGEIRAAQTQRVTYVVERVGPHSLAGLSLRWLEPRSGRFQEARVPDVKLWAAPNLSLGFQCLGTARGAALATEVSTLALLALLTVAIVRRLRHGPGRRERALERRFRERRVFHELLASVRHRPALVVLQKLYAWLDVRSPGGLERTLAPLTGATPEAAVAIATLERGLFREGISRFPLPGFVHMLRRARRVMRRKRTRLPLKSLNPTVPE